ncbi:hypothetical protein EUX98_g1045 [Antrodiella citrinella]|uniref:AB hydrolase-1 domain-containing protein n=1 Tax=Antrodiella citrinella TaxID=2447956 RepID=A0A4S4N2H2_9APHY|nr:hypothetical protein EUX98_g1045 [Antrodiella citrinella]
MSKKERQALFSRCFTQVRDFELAAGWFHPSSPTDVKKENMIEWLLWALFSCNPEDSEEEWEQELHEYVHKLEELMDLKLEPGLNERVRSMRITLDPVIMVHRPLVWYTIVWIVDGYTSVYMYRHGFAHYSRHAWFAHFPPRLFPRPSKTTSEPRISYWYRPHKSTTKRPIVFLHGIGIGLWPYCPYFSEIIAADPDVGIIAIESLNISMHMSPPPLDREEFLAALTNILDFHGMDQIVVSGHSYGTVLAAHMFKNPALSSRVVAWQLMDPIPFLLHLPAVAYNFVYRKPRTANEWQLWYFASRDADIARFLSRHFFWTDNILWKEDLKGKPVGVVLSGSDQIVDVAEVRRYLTGEKDMELQWKEGDLEVLFCPGLDHAQVFDTIQLRKPLVDMIMKFCELGGNGLDSTT